MSCSRLATSSSAQATTEAAGSRVAISWDRLGPLTTAIRSAPAPVTSAITSLIRLRLPSSTPFISETNGTSSGSIGRPLDEVVAERLRRDGEDDRLGAVDAPAPGRGWP